MGTKNSDEDKLRKITEVYRNRYSLPEDIDYGSFVSREYRTFKKEEIDALTRLNWYEKACKFCEKLGIKPDKKTAEKLQDKLNFANIRATPSGVISFTFLSIIILILFSAFLIIFDLISAPVGIFMLVGSVLFGLYIYSYPSAAAQVFRIKASEEMVLSILYMVISMRISPSLENAIIFSASNLSGPLAMDFRKIMWDIYMRKYYTIDEALSAYIDKKWKSENREFADALHMVSASLDEPEMKRLGMLDEAIDVILAGTKERMKHYAQNLRLPMLIIHAMGILLPIMGLILFPVIVIFMNDVVKPYMLFIGYDIALPLFLYWYTMKVLETKPPTVSQPDISKHPDVPKEGRFRVSKTLEIRTVYISIIIALVFVSFGAYGIYITPSGVAHTFAKVLYSTAIILGLGTAISFYCLANSFQRSKIRDSVRSIESEFGEAMFQLGNQLSIGIPIESAIERTSEKIKEMEISNFFLRIVGNMKKMGMTFKDAVFNKDYGAVWFYPSNLIISVMKVIIESVKKGVGVASVSILSIARYLKDTHTIEEDLRDILGETVSSMKFLGMFLAPMVAGVTVTMALVILDIMIVIQQQLVKIGGTATLSSGMPAFLMLKFGEVGLPAEFFQMIVGIYMIEIVYLLSVFVSRIETGEDKVGTYLLIGQSMIIAMVVYSVTIIFIYSIFGTPIQSLLLGTIGQ